MFAVRGNSMKKRITAFLDNDSGFGQLMTKLWIIIGSNLLFMVFSLPVVTIGPALVALYHVHLKSMRGYPDQNPVTEFWYGFRNNFKQAAAVWIIFLLTAAIALADIRFLAGQNGLLMELMRYMVCFISGALFVTGCILLPVMAAFADNLRGLCRNAIYFAARNPARAILIAALNAVPLFLSYMDVQRLPLYGFIWVACGFSLTARIISSLLLKDFSRFLPPPDEDLTEY